MEKDTFSLLTENNEMNKIEKKKLSSDAKTEKESSKLGHKNHQSCDWP